MFNWLTNILGAPAQTAKQQSKSRYVPLHTRLSLEELTSRDLPSSHLLGSSLAGMFAARHSASAFSSTAQHGVQINSSESSSSSSSDEGTGGHCGAHGAADYTATLANDSGATGTASYYIDNNTLKIQVKGAAASTALDVQLDGVSIGTLTTDASGNGSLTLKNLTTAVSASSVLTVGDLTGNFAQTKFTASLTGDTGLSGNASYNSLKHGLNLYITGAAAKTTYNVLIDGTSVGTLTTNKSGAGRFHLDLSTLDIKAGSVLSITDSTNTTILQGTFA